MTTPTTTTRRARRSAAADYLIAAAIALAIWPTSLGGWATFAAVSGSSMEPTFRHGDLAITYAVPHDVGDVVIYQPHDQPGTVIHRIIAGTPQGWVMRGDNNPADDPWTPSSDQVVGKVIARVPHAGWAVAALTTPLGQAAWLAGMVALFLWPFGARHTPSHQPEGAT